MSEDEPPRYRYFIYSDQFDTWLYAGDSSASVAETLRAEVEDLDALFDFNSDGDDAAPMVEFRLKRQRMTSEEVAALPELA